MFAGMLVGKSIGPYTLKKLFDILTLQDADIYNHDYILGLIPRELQLPGKFVEIMNKYCSDIDSKAKKKLIQN